MKKILNWSIFIISVCAFTAYFYSVDPSTPFQAFFAACFCSVIVVLIVLCLRQIKWRHDNGVDLFATLETDEEKLKEHMLFIMQYNGIEEIFKELNDIFRNYPQWHLEDWEVFRAWYKAQIDHMIENPEIYNLKLAGNPYDKEEDPMYDPDAPDWALYDRERDYSDGNYYDDDFDHYGDRHRRNRAVDAFSIGAGIGLVNGLTDGAVFGSGSSGSGT